MDPLEELIVSASQGDDVAIERLLDDHLPALRGYIARRAGALVRERESASDLAQSVCREALERVRAGRFDYQGPAAFKQWLYRAAVMKMMMRHRHWQAAKRDAGREVAPPAPDDSLAPSLENVAVAGGFSPSEVAMRQEDLERFERAFAELPERYKEVVVLHHVEALSHAEIAERLETTDANSRMLLSRALGRLATLLTTPEQESD
jgi:RNA polymerase sigma-70 factor (ECF subfamily)